jgi:hypothetical protein
MNKKRKVGPTFEVSRKGDILEQTTDGIAKEDREPNMLQDGVDRIV